MFVKLPRKTLVPMLEAEQVHLNALIEANHAAVKAKVRELTTVGGKDLLLTGSSGQMDPYVLELLIKERKEDERRKMGGGKIEEEEEESD